MEVKDELIHHLCHRIFIGTPDGKKLLQLMKEWHVNTPVFPCHQQVLDRHGGPIAWAAFRAGQLDLLLRIEVLANQFEQKVFADNEKLKSKDKGNV